MMAALNPVQSKPQLLQGPYGFLAGYCGVGSHQASSTMRSSSASLEGASGILFRFAIIDLM